MEIGQEIHLFGNWGILHFIENNGMAFGMEMGGKTGKFILSIFRIFAIIRNRLVPQIIDCQKGQSRSDTCSQCYYGRSYRKYYRQRFYGMIFSESFNQPAILFPPGGGYSSFLHGRVVDMFYFPIINTHWPDWSPLQSRRIICVFQTGIQYC